MAGKVLNIRAPGPVSDLDDLAKQIDAAHVEVAAALLTSVQRAAEVGHLLAQAKEQVPYGQWEAWVEQNTAVSPRTARGYMQAARYWTEADKAKRRALADLGLQGVLAEIARPKAVAFHVADAEEEPRTIRVRIEEVEPEPTTGVTVIEPAPKTIMTPAYNVLELNNDPTVAALRLIGDLDPDALARASKLDGKINLEDLAALLSDAAILALQ